MTQPTASSAALKAQVEWQQAMLDKYDADNTELIQENAALKAEMLRPATQCDCCDEYYLPYVMRTEALHTPLCPGCYKSCAEEMASFTGSDEIL